MENRAATLLFATLGLVLQPAVASRPVLRAAQARGGTISGIVVDEHQEPVARVQVQAFSVRSSVLQPQTVPLSIHPSGTASTDAAGRFQISGLDVGDYLVAAEAVPSLTSGASSQRPLYGTTFYPSMLDSRVAVPVSALPYETAPIRIELVQVSGARVAGSVVGVSGHPTSGMGVRLFHTFGAFGSESAVAVVRADGTFEIPHVPPGWYRLTIAPRQGTRNLDRPEFATTLVEVHDRDIDGLVLELGTGAVIAGRVVPEPGARIPSAVGLRVVASPAPEQYAPPRPIAATVASDWSFQMTGLAGWTRFTAGSDRAPFVKATRISIDGVEEGADRGVELTEGAHDVVVFVAPVEMPVPALHDTLSSAALVELFERETVFWRQFTIGKEIADRREVSVVPSLVPWLSHEDRHIRGNAAFTLAALGDPRGFQAIVDMLADRSDRLAGQGIPGAPSDGRYRVQQQIRADRYYAAHLLGDLRDRRAVPVLVPLLKDEDVNSIVPWALGQIGDKRAVAPLLDVLDEASPSMCVLTVYALETLDAKEAIPRLISLLNDQRKARFGSQVSCSEAARAAIAALR